MTKIRSLMKLLQLSFQTLKKSPKSQSSFSPKSPTFKLILTFWSLESFTSRKKKKNNFCWKTYRANQSNSTLETQLLHLRKTSKYMAPKWSMPFLNQPSGSSLGPWLKRNSHKFWGLQSLIIFPSKLRSLDNV